MNLILTNVNLVTLADGPAGYELVTDQYVEIRAGKIHSVRPMSAWKPERVTPETPVHNCGGKLLTPGLIDCHTHLIYAGSRAQEFELRLQGTPYEEIARKGGGILSTVRATRAASEQQLTESALPRLDGLIASGVTTLEIKSGYGLTTLDELKMLRAAKALQAHRKINISTTLLAAHAVPPEFQGNADGYIDLVCAETIPQAAEEGLADSVDVFCENIAFTPEQCERVFIAASQYGLAIKAHTEQLSLQGGSELAARYGALSVDHIEYLGEQGVKALAEHGTVATLLPGAFYFLRETQMPPVEALRHHKVPMALSTDLNPGTSPFADLTLMMNMACTLFRLTPEEALRGVTSHAAKALGLSATKGRIEPGMDADLALWNISHSAELSYQCGIPRLNARIVNGELNYV